MQHHGWPNAAPDTFFAAQPGAARLDRPGTAVCIYKRARKLAIIVIVSGLTQANLHASRLSVFLDNRTLNTFPWQSIQPQ